MKKIDHLKKIATMYGVGRLPHAPATWGTVFFLPVVFLLALYTNPLIYMVFTILFIILSICSAQAYAQGVDSKEIVIDEVIGQSIPIYLYEIAHGTNKNPQEAILFYIYIFFLFRFFDIKKPFPVNYFDKNFKNNFGVIIDDVIAGFYVVLTLIIFMIIKSKLFA